MKKIEVYTAPAGGWASLRGTALTLIGKDTLLKGGSTMRRVNQPDGGIKCPSCAWPDASHAKSIDFCESGAKAVAFESTANRITPEFFAQHTVSELKNWSDYELDQLGRLTQPLKYDAVTDKYVAVEWQQAFDDIGTFLRQHTTPERAVFYTSGKVGNEPAFCYQLMVREYGSNNLPDCSNMCHEPTSVALAEQIGVGKATVIRSDFAECDLILSMGHNPGTNHPRSLIALREARKDGATIVAVNPMREKSLIRYRHPQSPVEMLTGTSTNLASEHYVQVKVGGDSAFLTGVIKAFLEHGTPDYAFINQHTSGFDAFKHFIEQQDWTVLEQAAGVSQQQMQDVAHLYDQSKNTICMWGMGITQHENSLDNVHLIVNLLLLKGNIGRAGSGLCPVRGHSNVQGNRTVGIHEKPDQAMLDRIEKYFGFAPPRKDGLDTLATLQAMQQGQVDFLMGLAGNFAKATPDTKATLRNLDNLKMTVMVSISLNRSHLHHGQQAYILPALARTEGDHQDSGFQGITIEDSMCNITLSTGTNPPASNQLRSETAIIAGIAKSAIPNSRIPWDKFLNNYDYIRDAIAETVEGFADFNTRVRQPRGFYLGNSARERNWKTKTQKAQFIAPQLPFIPDVLQQPDTFRLTTVRAHGQFNTTIYDLNDRYRGVYGERDVLFMHPDQISAKGWQIGQRVDVTAIYDNQTRCLNQLKLMPFDLPMGCVATYYPEANDLVPLQHHAPRANTPAYKSIPVRIQASV
jgi:molybdopterin-dependent oxidoreductase alpha subunit